MKIDSRFIIKCINGHNVIIDSQNNKVCGDVDFNEIKMFLWQLAKEQEVSKAQMLEETLKRFEISTVLSLGEIDYFIKKIKEYGII